MISRTKLLVFSILLVTALLSACSPPDLPAPISLGSAPSAESTSDQDAILVERTPEPTSTPNSLTRAVADFGESVGSDTVSFLGLTGTDWINLAISWLIVLAGYGIGGITARIIIPRLTRRVPRPYDREIRAVISPKIRQLFGLFGLWFATQRLEFLGVDIKFFLYDLYFLLGLIISSQIVLKIIDVGAKYYTESLEPTERQAEMAPIISLLTRLAYAIVIVGVLAIGLDRFGINITALAAALGIAGLGFALAAQDTIADAIAGMLILADRPFRLGDRIFIQAIDTWGDVVEIGLRTTRIRTRDNRMVIVPNSTISKNEVVNFSYPDPRYRIQTHVGIGYEADFEKARQVMIDAVRNTKGVLKDKPVEVLYIEMADSEMKFRVRWWIDSYVDTRRMLDTIHTALQNALDGAGIPQAYPVRELRNKMNSQEDIELRSGLGKPDGLEVPNPED